jgi:hypothetical protein
MKMRGDDNVSVKVKKSVEVMGASSDNVVEHPLLKFFKLLTNKKEESKNGNKIKRSNP